MEEDLPGFIIIVGQFYFTAQEMADKIRSKESHGREGTSSLQQDRQLLEHLPYVPHALLRGSP